jgi:hypothetical protein
MSPFRETAVSRPRKPLWLDPPRTCTQQRFAYSPPPTPHPMESPTTDFPLEEK